MELYRIYEVAKRHGKVVSVAPKINADKVFVDIDGVQHTLSGMELVSCETDEDLDAVLSAKIDESQVNQSK